MNIKFVIFVHLFFYFFCYMSLLYEIASCEKPICTVMFEVTHTKKNSTPVNEVIKEKIVCALIKHLFNIIKYCANY
jgi:hypothetical protein